MVVITSEETQPALEDLQQGRNQLLTAMKRFLEALQDIAALPCASDLPLCHNPGCASCRARRALAFSGAGGEWVHRAHPPSGTIRSSPGRKPALA
jgi:hypothetical protein